MQRLKMNKTMKNKKEDWAEQMLDNPYKADADISFVSGFHSDRQKAIEWWESLPFALARCKATNLRKFPTQPDRLTGREVEELWKADCR